MSWIELLGVVTGLVCVFLTVRESVWCWPIGIVSCIAFFEVFRDAKLYADMVLQLVYVLMSIYGWYRWARPDPDGVVLPISRAHPNELGAALVFCTTVALGWGWTLRTYTDASLPYWDAGTVAASLAAQWMLTRKKIENWLVWIGTDIVLIGVYLAKDLYLTAGLYVLYTGLAIAGYVRWQRELGR